MYKRILLKLSGEALSDGQGNIYCQEHLDSVCEEVATLNQKQVQIGIVVGGGNIFRGKLNEELGMNRNTGDYMGMMATCMNALALSNTLKKVNVKCKILGAFAVSGIIEHFSASLADSYLNDGYVVIYAGGTGLPYFSTDTCAALRALETNCEVILAAKNGVDGVYSSDPKKDKNAQKYFEITYREIIEKNLQVMDLTAISLCKENKMPLIVFNMNQKGNIIKVVLGENIGTIVK